MVVCAVKFDRLTRRSLRLNGLLAIVAIIVITALLAWLSVQNPRSFDATESGRNSLSQTSVAVLEQLTRPVTVTAYARTEPEHRARITNLISRYSRHKTDLLLQFRDPDSVPDELRNLGITTDGELLIRYANRTEHVIHHTEQAFSNALQRLGRAEDQWLFFLEGHGERQPLGTANHDLGVWGVGLEKKGFKLQSLNLANTATVPGNAAVLIVASPMVKVLPEEAKTIVQHIETGGNLLWLAEPAADHGLDLLAEALGIKFVTGTIVDPTSRRYKNADPTFAVVSEYAAHPSTEGFRYTTLYPRATAIEVVDDSRYLARALLETAPGAWSEAGVLDGEVGLDASIDTPGPLTLGLSLTRQRHAKDGDNQGKQRIAVLGDGDFLSNTYVGNSGNLDFGLRIITWLAADDDFLKIPARTTNNHQFELDDTTGLFLAICFLFGFPLSLAGCGSALWWHRRRS